MRRRLPQGVRMYTGDDFNYAELIAGDAARATRDALLGIFDAIAPAASRRAGGARAAATSRRFHAILAPTVPLSRHIFQRADALLQDRRRVHGLAQRPPVPFHDGRRPAERALAPAPGRAVPAGRPRRPAARSGARRRAHALRAGGAGVDAAALLHRGIERRIRPEDDTFERSSVEFEPRCAVRNAASRCATSRRPRPALDQHRHGAQAGRPRRDHRGLRAARHPRDLAVARPGRGGRPRPRRAGRRGRRARALRLLPRRHVPGADARRRGRRALDDNRRAVDEAAALGAPCLVLVVGGLPRRSRPARRRRRTSPPRAAGAATASPRLLEYARAAGMPLAIEPLHPMYAADRACVNTLEQALDLCDALDPRRTRRARRRGRRLPRLVGPEARRRRSRAPARERLLAFHVCDWLVPTRDLLNDRGMMGDGVIDLRRIRGWVEAPGFAGYSEVEIFSNDWWKRPDGRGARHLHRAASHGRLSSFEVVPAEAKRRAGTHVHAPACGSRIAACRGFRDDPRWD